MLGGLPPGDTLTASQAAGPAAPAEGAAAPTVAEPVQEAPTVAEPVQDAPVQAGPQPIPDAPLEAETESVTEAPVQAEAAEDDADEPIAADLQAESAYGAAGSEPAEAGPADPSPGPRGPDSPTTSMPILGPSADRPGSATPRRPVPRPIPVPQPTRPQPVIRRPDPQPTRPQPVIRRSEPQPTRPQPVIPRSDPQPTRPQPVVSQQAPSAERNRPAGALPWILPTAGQAPFQAADALTTTAPPEAPHAHSAPAPEQAPLIEPAPPAPAEQAPPTAPPAAKKPRGQAHAATYKEAEVVSGADTVMLPKLKPQQTTAAAGSATTGKKNAAARGSTTGTEGAPVKVDEQPTTIMPVQTLPRSVPAPVLPEQPYRPGRRRKWLSRAVLLAILMMQAVLSLRLHNTAFEDEAQYLYAGKLEIAHLFHGVPLPLDYASYFSGAPVLYPVLGAAASNIGGLAAARAVSLLEMLATTGLLYMISRRLFNERVAICAALLFSVTESVTFLGNFATYDASCLFLLAAAAWIMVRTALSRWPLFLLAAPVAALAVATKYAGLLYVPTIAVLPVLTAWPYRRRRAWVYPVIFSVAVGVLLYGALRWGGHSYTNALKTTTTSRATGNTPILHIGWESLKWGGVQFGMALLGTVAYAWRPRTDREEEIAPAGSRLRRILLGLVLTGTALLAPAYQAHIHTDVSFLKHIGFGLFFAAPMAGVGLARVLGDHFRRPQLGIAVWGLAILLGMTQATSLFGAWGNATGYVPAFARYLQPGAYYLVEVPEVPIYYLEGHKGALAKQFSSTFTITYQNPQGVILTGVTGYEAAINNDFFQVVALEGLTTPGIDNAITSELTKNRDYRLAAVVKDDTKYHTGAYSIWVRKTAPRKGTAGKLIG